MIPADPKYKVPAEDTGDQSSVKPGLILPSNVQSAPLDFTPAPMAPTAESKAKTSWAYVVKRAHNGAMLAGLGLATATIVTVFVVAQNRLGQGTTVQSDYGSTETNLSTVPGSSLGREGETLTIGADTILKGKLTAGGDVDIIGSLNNGAPLNVSALQVAGSAVLTTAEVKSNLAVSGTSSLQGNVTVANLLTAGSLNVTGNSSVGGTLTAGNLNVRNQTLTGVLTLGGHVISSGATPSISSGGAVGGAGTVSISGNDRAGTVTINTGQAPPAGVLANVTFRSAYGNTPRVIISPIGSSSGALQYYLNRTSGGFTISTLSAPPQGTSFAFDYIVEQ